MKHPIRHYVVFALALVFGGALLETTVSAAGIASSRVRKKLVIVVAEKAYETPKSLAEFAPKFLEADFRVVFVTGSMAPGQNGFDHMEQVVDADVILVSVVRRAPPREQLEILRRYIEAGKPVVGIRTASHAFVLSPNQKPPEGCADWPTWDADINGGNYHGHYRIPAVTTITGVHAGHPILRGVPLPFTSTYQLYKASPLLPDAKPVLSGAIPGEPAEPVAWTFTRKDGGHTFYTSLGAPGDFQNPAFTTLLRNGILWAAGTLEPK